MIGEVPFQSPIATHLLVQATACLALGLAGSYLLRHRAARAHQILFLGLLSALLLPALHALVGHLGMGVLAPPPVVPSQETAVPRAIETMSTEELPAAITADAPVQAQPPEAEASLPAEPIPAPPLRTARLSPRRALMGCWMLTTFVLFGHLLMRFALGLRVLATSSELTDPDLRAAITVAKTKVGIDSPVRLRCSQRVRSPIVWCWTRVPVLLVHKQIGSRADDTDWVGIFCHELAHFKRADHISALFAGLLAVALPWHPLLWWAKRRLLRLSEEVCDDWAVAHAPTSIDYAESLLELSPERQLAFLPTVVGKEKTMKARIRRIVKDKCGNPRTGARWSFVIGMLALLATVSVAFAQRRPIRVEQHEVEEREEIRERRASQELARAGRRNVLQRILEQLVAEARQTEAAVREHGDEMGEEGHILRAELEALHEHIESVERQLHSLERRAHGHAEEEQQRRVRRRREEAEEHARELVRHREELIKHAHRLEKELEHAHEDRPETKEKLEVELHVIRERAKGIDEELQELERARADVRRRITRVTRRRGSEVDEHARALAERMRDLRTETAEAERELERTEDREGDEAHDLRAHIDELRRHMRDTEKELHALRTQRSDVERERRAGTQRRRENAQATREGRGIEGEVEELRAKVNGMHEEMVQMRELMEQFLQRWTQEEEEVQEMIQY